MAIQQLFLFPLKFKEVFSLYEVPNFEPETKYSWPPPKYHRKRPSRGMRKYIRRQKALKRR